MSKYDEIENIHSYHGTREKIGVDVSGVEIDHSKRVEYSTCHSEAARADMEADGWEVTASWRDGSEIVYSMRKEVRI